MLDPAKPPTGANVKAAKLALLSRPYPQAIAGTPESFGFDPGTRRFGLRYRTARAGGGALASGTRTEIALPARQYPGGYDVAVEGIAGNIVQRDGLQHPAFHRAGSLGDARGAHQPARRRREAGRALAYWHIYLAEKRMGHEDKSTDALASFSA